MDNEKKFKLDELPDQGSSSEFRPTPKIAKPLVEPRVENLKGLDQPQRLEALSLRWHFDRPKKLWGWLIVLSFLLYIEKSGVLAENLHKRGPDELINSILDAIYLTLHFDYLARHPFALALLIPVFFKFQKRSEFHFDITFDGLETVRSIAPRPREGVVRVKVKWAEIIAVRKEIKNNREILVISDAIGDIAELIWDIEDIKKRVIKQVLKGLVSTKNPFRLFIEKDVA
jgi:hypothetical protein